MSDLDSPDGTPADGTPATATRERRSSKRRRVHNDGGDSEGSTPRYSSPDDQDMGMRMEEDGPYRSPNRDSEDRRRSQASDGSPDELDHPYRDRSRSRSIPTSTDTPRECDSSHSHSPLGGPSPPSYKPLKLNYKQKFILRGHRKGVAQVRFSPDGRWIASCSADGTIKIWDAATGKHMRTLQGHLAGVSTIAWSPDSNTIASGSDDKAIRLWHRATGRPYPAPLLGHHNYVYSLAFSPKGNMLVSGSYDEAIFLWDLRARRQMRSLPAHSDPVGGVDFIKDGTLVCSCSTDGLIRVWDTATGQCLRTLVHEDNAPVTTARFSPNGRYILAWTLDSCIRLWDYVSGQCKKTYQGHVNTKYSLGGAFGVGGTEGFIVSGSEEGDILFWDVQNKNVVQRVTGHEGVVCWIDTCPGASGTIASGGLDGTVRIWVDVPDEDGIDRLKLEDEIAENGYTNADDVGMDRLKVEENADDGNNSDTPWDDMSIDGHRNPEREAERLNPDGMDED
ncbi:WD40 repeat-like protein [Venustampulla echinocandica]|uniref:Mitochondrial division protein 1 n=1 Tax=Venustampulla echinocandica TaxID=2656787 RepID=A0A370THV2_9HELO|nr:WD40 repeat-like protein [Venustampulla echinocandica]RDL34776.1 WD40 repeat-like protein [Venustampulla echinocandica]